VVIMGGGLAGLTLALQLRQRLPGLKVLVLERRQHPVPVATHKVGESTVEIGAHYFTQVLGLQAHFVEKQLRKFGFRFFFSEGQSDLAACTELGPSRALAVGSWQIDRGIFENFLGQEVQRCGIDFEPGALVHELHLAPLDQPKGLHTVTWQRSGAAASTAQASPTAETTETTQTTQTTASSPTTPSPQTARAHWVVDACGRASLIKRQLGLARSNAHGPHAVWFRIQGHLLPDEWVDSPAWRARCVTPSRWLSTNHLVGAGYWVWLIPLASGSHSVGIVADPRWHPLAQMNTFERAMDWLLEHQPRLFAALDPQRDKLQDFHFLKHFSHDCKQVFSAQRWALAGEAGRFLDPLYSPGSDFIAIGNTYITELVARERAGQSITAHVDIYEQVFRSMYDHTLTLYQDQYGLLGDPEVLPIKIFWDYSYYWGVLAKLFFHGGLTDLVALGQMRDELGSIHPLNVAVQTFVRQMSAHSSQRNPPVLLDQASMPWFAELNRSLADPATAAQFKLRLRDSARRLRQLATEILDRAQSACPLLERAALAAAIEAAGGAVRTGHPMLFPAVQAAA
jgi:flavin-dependent dehydrogenase